MEVVFVKTVVVNGNNRELEFVADVDQVPCCAGTVLVNVGESKQTEIVKSTRLDLETGQFSVILEGEPKKVFDSLSSVDDFEYANKGWLLRRLETEPPSRHETPEAKKARAVKDAQAKAAKEAQDKKDKR